MNILLAHQIFLRVHKSYIILTREGATKGWSLRENTHLETHVEKKENQSEMSRN